MRGGTALVVLAVLVLAGSLASAEKKDGSLQAEQRKLKDTQRRLDQEKQRAAEARRRESSLLAELERIDERLKAKQREVRRLDTRIQRVQAEIAALRGDIDRLQRFRAVQEQALAQRLRTMYKIHTQGAALPVLLGSDDAVARMGLLRQLGSLAALDARLIREYRETSANLADRKTREEARQGELAGLRSDARREQADVDRDAGRRRVLLAKVQGERAYHERMVGELTEAARRLEAFVRDLQARQRRLARTPPPQAPGAPGVARGFGLLRGRLPWPTEGRIVAAYGPQVHPRFGTRTFRSGVDIEAAEGTEVAAVASGQVVYTGWFKGYGNLIILDHGNEYYTLYAHVADILVKEDDDVRAGQRIGTVGDTGSLSGPRLYFEVRYQGKPQDPAEWLRQRG